MPNKNPHALGLEGEALALDYLCTKGYRHLQSRYKTRWGEIDLIMQDGDTLVFVEVKYRQKGHYGDGIRAIRPDKLSKWLKACEEYLSQYDTDSAVRLDVVEITADGISHWENVTG